MISIDLISFGAFPHAVRLLIARTRTCLCAFSHYFDESQCRSQRLVIFIVVGIVGCQLNCSNPEMGKHSTNRFFHLLQGNPPGGRIDDDASRELRGLGNPCRCAGKPPARAAPASQ